ncbi:MAG: glycosyltransferase family 9 protein, partial [Chitinophagaceae bacterium]
DIVLASPVFRCVKKQLPDAVVHLATKESFKMVTASNPYIDAFHYYNNDLAAFIKELKDEDFDYVIDLHNNIRSTRIRKALKKKTFVIDKQNIKKFFLTEYSAKFLKIRHITERSLDTVAKLGVSNDGLGLDYFVAKENVVPINDIPASHHAGFVAFVTGATYNCKKLPLQKMQELAVLIDHPIILIGGKGDFEEMEKVAAIDPVKIYNACGKFNLDESADLVSRAKLVISHDTGFQYIAAAFKKPIIALWGCTSPRLGFEPYYGEKFISRAPRDFYKNIFLDLHCQPCSKGTDQCPLGHFNCMRKMDMKMVANEVHKRL